MYAILVNNSGWSVHCVKVFKEDAKKERQELKIKYPLGCCRLVSCTSTVDAMNIADSLNNK